MGLGARQLDPVPQYQLFHLRFESLSLRTTPNDLHLEAAATTTKDISRRNQIPQPLFLNQPRNRKDHRLGGLNFCWQFELKLRNVEPMIDAVQLSIAQGP